MEYPYLRRVYGLLGAEKNVENLHLHDEGHDYGYSKRVGAYGFFARHLDLNQAAVADKTGRVDESFVRILKEHELLVLNAEHRRPESALQGAGEAEAAFWK